MMGGTWRVLCDWRYVWKECCVIVGVKRECCMMGGMWRVLYDGRYVESVMRSA